jgi:crossover junction endodeoxyribonuclease RusA
MPLTLDVVTLWVPGIPQPGGSKRAFLHRKTRRPIVTDDCRRNKDWRAVVALCAVEHFREPLDGPLGVDVEFCVQRPKGHMGKRGLRPSAPTYPTVRPDATKLWRSTEDALTGIAWRDDSQIVIQTVRKVYGVTPGARIRVWRIEQE